MSQEKQDRMTTSETNATCGSKSAVERLVSGRDMVTQAIIDLLDARLTRQELDLFRHRMDDYTYERRCGAADKRIHWREAMVSHLFKTRHVGR